MSSSIGDFNLLNTFPNIRLTKHIVWSSEVFEVVRGILNSGPRSRIHFDPVSCAGSRETGNDISCIGLPIAPLGFIILIRID